MESISIWAKLEIASAETCNRRQAIGDICRIGIFFHSHSNQYAAIQIYLTLMSTDIRKFETARKVLDENIEYKKFMQRTAALINTSQNNKRLRNDVYELQPPAIPYLGVFLKDAFMVDEQLYISKLARVYPQQMHTLYVSLLSSDVAKLRSHSLFFFFFLFFVKI